MPTVAPNTQTGPGAPAGGNTQVLQTAPAIPSLLAEVIDGLVKPDSSQLGASVGIFKNVWINNVQLTSDSSGNLYANGVQIATGSGDVTQVSNTDGSITVSPTTGSVVVSFSKIVDPTDHTKQIKFSVSGNTTGKVLTIASQQSTSQTLSAPNITASDTIATLGIANVFTQPQTIPIVNNTAAQTTLNGTTAGTAVWSQPEQGSSYKRMIVYFSGYENNSSTAQTITYTTAFTNTPIITANSSGLTINSNTTTLTIVAPNNTTTYTGWLIIEGY